MKRGGGRQIAQRIGGTTDFVLQIILNAIHKRIRYDPGKRHAQKMTVARNVFCNMRDAVERRKIFTQTDGRGRGPIPFSVVAVNGGENRDDT